jgi:hypothetical protein
MKSKKQSKKRKKSSYRKASGELDFWNITRDPKQRKLINTALDELGIPLIETAVY